MVSEHITFSERATLLGLVQVALRTGESARLRYLSGDEINHVLNDTSHSYKTEGGEKQSDFPAAIPIPAE